MPKHVGPIERNCYECGKRYTVTWRTRNAIRCDDCGVNHADDDENAPIPDAAEVAEIQRFIMENWRVTEAPAMDDIDCIKESRQIVQRICNGPQSNQLDELKILFYTTVGVLNTMNIVHGGRGVAVKMMIDMLEETADHFPPEDALGDTHGADTLPPAKEITMDLEAVRREMANYKPITKNLGSLINDGSK